MQSLLIPFRPYSHTIFFTQYCDKKDKKILRHWYFLAIGFYWTNKVSSYKNLVYLALSFDKSIPRPIDIHGPKISFLSQYCARKCPVWIGPSEGIFVISFRFRSIRNLKVRKCRRRIILYRSTLNTILFDSPKVVLNYQKNKREKTSWLHEILSFGGQIESSFLS